MLHKRYQKLRSDSTREKTHDLELMAPVTDRCELESIKSPEVAVDVITKDLVLLPADVAMVAGGTSTVTTTGTNGCACLRQHLVANLHVGPQHRKVDDELRLRVLVARKS